LLAGRFVVGYLMTPLVARAVDRMDQFAVTGMPCAITAMRLAAARADAYV